MADEKKVWTDEELEACAAKRNKRVATMVQKIRDIVMRDPLSASGAFNMTQMVSCIIRENAGLIAEALDHGRYVQGCSDRDTSIAALTVLKMIDEIVEIAAEPMRDALTEWMERHPDAVEERIVGVKDEDEESGAPFPMQGGDA